MMPFRADDLHARHTALLNDARACFAALPVLEQQNLKLSNRLEGEDLYMHGLLGQTLAWMYLRPLAAQGLPLTEQAILHAHGYLMQAKLPEADIGRYRREAVYMASDGGMEDIFAPYREVPDLMMEWLADFNAADTTLWDLHQRFLNIHPFIDGNGRVARLLWAYDQIRRGGNVSCVLWRFTPDDMPKEATLDFEATSAAYYAALKAGTRAWHATHAGADPDPAQQLL